MELYGKSFHAMRLSMAFVRMMSVSVRLLSLSVANMGGGGFSLSMIVRRAAVTARMSWGL